jgi:hypothetical protein
VVVHGHHLDSLRVDSSQGVSSDLVIAANLAEVNIQLLDFFRHVLMAFILDSLLNFLLGFLRDRILTEVVVPVLFLQVLILPRNWELVGPTGLINGEAICNGLIFNEIILCNEEIEAILRVHFVLDTVISKLPTGHFLKGPLLGGCHRDGRGRG